MSLVGQSSFEDNFKSPKTSLKSTNEYLNEAEISVYTEIARVELLPFTLNKHVRVYTTFSDIKRGPAESVEICHPISGKVHDHSEQLYEPTLETK